MKSIVKIALGVFLGFVLIILALLLVFGSIGSCSNDSVSEMITNTADYESDADDDEEMDEDYDSEEDADSDSEEDENYDSEESNRSTATSSTNKRNDSKSEADKYYNGDDKNDKNNIKPGE